jgi:hypothetical protein
LAIEFLPKILVVQPKSQQLEAKSQKLKAKNYGLVFTLTFP